MTTFVLPSSAFADSPPINPTTVQTTSVQLKTSTQPAPLDAYYNQEVQWRSCGQDRCAEIRVPVSYDSTKTDGTDSNASQTPETPSIAIAIRQFGDPSLPALLVNPGGPGAPGIDFAQYISQALDPAVSERFSVVGFDPRGTGRSAPISCFNAQQLNAWLRIDITPDTARERRNLMKASGEISQRCLADSPETAAFIGTEETVQDLDVIRAVLGNEKLNWLGFSYGTTIGTRYAELFPDRVGKMVLDGAVDPQLDAMGLSQGQSKGFQLALTRFNKSYPGSIARINKILASLERKPMITTTQQNLVEAQGINAVFYSMYSKALWPDLNKALRLAMRGDGTALQKIAYSAYDQVAPNKFNSDPMSAFLAINCWDFPATPPASGLAQAARSWQRGAKVPALAQAMSWGNAPCSSWFGHSTHTPAPANTSTGAPIVIVGTTYDPATPYTWARSLARQLPTSSLITYRGDGHTAYLSGHRCVDNAVNKYLLGGVTAQQITCK